MTRANWPESRFPLPGGWRNADGSTECRRYHSAVLRTLTGYEEEWLAHRRDVPNAIKTSRLLTACVLSLDDDEPPHDMARRMLIGDRDYKKFLNTRNELYREKRMKQSPPTRAETLTLMAKHPNLIKRPILVKGKNMLLGFDPDEFKQIL